MFTVLPTSLATVLLLVTSAAAAPPATPNPPASPAWTAVAPGGDTGCATDETPFRFFVREGPDPSKLLVWFQGGGACWDFVSCAGMFDRSVVDGELDPYGGIFDFGDPENPFAGYSVVFVPYCTGDVHVGDATVTYGRDGAAEGPPVRHLGWTNVDAVLDWMREHTSAPERLVVAGASAGSYGAVFHAPRVAALYPGADLVVIGDSGVPLLHDYGSILARWGGAARLRALWGVTADEAVTVEAAHAFLARERPDARLAQVTSDRDRIQGAFYLVSGSPAWREETFRILRSLERDLPFFRAFVIEGVEHGLLRDEYFGDRSADGTSLRAWIGDLVEGRPVESVYCAACVEGD